MYITCEWYARLIRIDLRNDAVPYWVERLMRLRLCPIAIRQLPWVNGSTNTRFYGGGYVQLFSRKLFNHILLQTDCFPCQVLIYEYVYFSSLSTMIATECKVSIYIYTRASNRKCSSITLALSLLREASTSASVPS